MPVPLSHPKLHDLIQSNKLHHGLLRQIAAELPEDDAALDALIAESVAHHDARAFNYLVITALANARPVDARHLVGGVQLMRDMHWLCVLSWKMQGEVAEHLIEAVATTVTTRELAATALVLATTWSQQFREGRLPDKLIRLAREMAREPEANKTQVAFLWRIAQSLNDSDLTAILRATHPLPVKPGPNDLVEKIGSATLAVCGMQVLECVPEKPDNLIASGPHLRRAAARVGRNDPCPCGSGKKFKKCCEGKDERMRELSTVEGKTRAEVAAEPEPHLTEAKLAKLQIYEVAQLDVTKLPPSVHVAYLLALDRGFLFDEIAAAFEKLGCKGKEMEAAWDHIIQNVAMKQRLDVARRMVEVRYQDGPVPKEIYFRVRLLLASEDPVRYAELMEEQAKLALTSGDEGIMMEFGFAMLHSNHPFVGLHCARGLVPLIGKRWASRLLYFVELWRDRLNLPPEEPMAELLEKRFAEEVADDGKDAAELRQARGRLDAKVGEVNELKEKLEELRREIRLQEKRTPAATNIQTAVEPKELRELREKVRGLKSSITARNEERAMFRRELGQAYADLEALRAQQAAASTGNGSHPATGVDAEDALLVPGDIDSNQPPRPIEFPRRFNDTLNHLPRQVGRAALILLGRIAAGDPTAFTGAIRLKLVPDVMRVRVGMEHRMLFRLLPETVQLVDLINRRDLERTIEGLCVSVKAAAIPSLPD